MGSGEGRELMMVTVFGVVERVWSGELGERHKPFCKV